MKQTKRLLSALLVICMLMGMVPVNAHAHTVAHDDCEHSYETEVIDPTCEDEGYTLYICEECGDEYEDDYVDALGHNYAVAEVVDPTCEDEGYTIYICEECDDEYEDDYVDALGHSFERGECTVCGEADPDCDHRYRAEEFNPTCEDEGYTSYTCEKCGHWYEGNYVDPIGHIYEVEVTDATCEDKGYMTYTCQECGYWYDSDYVDALGHSYTAGEVIDPTCEDEGYTIYICELCGDWYEDDYVDALSHSYTAEVFEPTCEDKGCTTYTCEICGDWYDEDETDALGHDYQEGFCTVCGENDPNVFGMGTCGENITWLLDGNGVLTISGTGTMDDYDAEDAPWFENRWNVEKVVIEDGVTSIGNHAFYDCYWLETAQIPVTVTTIGEGAFMWCGIEKVVIPEGVTTIANEAFMSSDVTEVIIPDSVTTLGEHAFSNCSALTKVTIGSGVTTIGDFAFNYCYELEELTIGNGVKTIGDCAFAYCEDLEEVIIPDSVTMIGMYAFENCLELESVKIGNGVTVIGAYAFSGCEALRELIFGNRVTSICAGAFFGCESLVNVTIPNSVTFLDDGVFINCYALKNVTIGSNVDAIGEGTFLSCESLGSVTIPASVTAIGEAAFGYCETLTEINFLGDAPSIGYDAFYNVVATAKYPVEKDSWTRDVLQDYCGEIIWIHDGDHRYITEQTDATCTEDGKIVYTCSCGDTFNAIIAAPGHNYQDGVCTVCGDNDPNVLGMGTCGKNITWLLDGNGVLTISGTGTMDDYEKKDAPWFQHRWSLKKVVIEEGVTYIGDYAFYNCERVTSVTIPESVTVIGESAFEWCRMEEVVIPERVTTIGDRAFANCQSLVEVIIPDSVTVIGDSAFSTCAMMEKVTIGNGVKRIGSHAFTSCYTLKNLTIGSNVNTIGDHAFYYCLSLPSVIIPASVTSIEGGAFQGCDSLTEIVFLGDAPSVDLDAFYGIVATAKYPVEKDSWTLDVIQANYYRGITWIHDGDHRYITEQTDATCTLAGEIVYTCSCGDTYSETIVAPGHAYSSEVIAPDCEFDGYTTYTCMVCGDCYDGDYVDAVGHSYTAEITAPTCEDRGYTTYTCETCGDWYDGDYVDAVGHSYTAEVTAPTCMTGGYTIYTCEICGDWDYGDFVDAIGHSYTAEVIDPTCTEDGYTIYTCEVCGDGYDDDYVDAVGHNYTAEIIDPTCTEDGYTIYTCEVCGDEYDDNYVDAVGHSYTAEVTAPTCTEGGYTTYNCAACGHTYTNDYTDVLDHDYEEVVTPVTCTTNGYTTFTCSVCKYSYQDFVVIARGHYYYIFTDVPTCETNGQTVYICDCGDTYTETIAALGHDYIGKVTAPTCEDDGYTTYTCEKCGNWYDDDYVDAAGHSYTAEETAPTCEAEGKTVYICDCGDTYTETIAALGHDYTATVTAPTCTEDGYTIYTCAACGDWYGADYTEATGHSYENGVCSGCGDVDKRLGVPTVSASNVASSGKIKLSWNKVEGAAKYQIYRATSKSGTYSLMKTTSSTSYTNTSAEVGKAYYYYVVALDANGDMSDNSKIVSRTCDLAQPVITLSNRASDGAITIKWDEIAGTMEYKIYRAESKSGDYMLLQLSNAASYIDTSAEAGKAYYYKVMAVHEKSAANSAYSAIKTQTADLPQPTITLSNVASSGKIKVSWEEIDGAKAYEVYRAVSESGGYTLMKTTTSLSYTNTSAVAGNAYYYKVVAVHANSDANSAESEVVSRTCALPQTKVTLSNVSSSGKIKVSWDEVEGAVAYKIYRATSKTGEYKLMKTATGSTYTNTSAQAGKAYYYKVVAVHANTDANSDYSEIKSRTCDLARPVVSVSLSTSGKPVVSWNEVDGAVKYTVYMYDANGDLVKSSNTTKTKLTFTSATKGQTYTYKVMAVHENTNANSAKSTGVSIKSK